MGLPLPVSNPWNPSVWQTGDREAKVQTGLGDQRLPSCLHGICEHTEGRSWLLYIYCGVEIPSVKLVPLHAQISNRVRKTWSPLEQPGTGAFRLAKHTPVFI